MKTAIFATFLASAAAFAPSSEKASSSALSAFKDDVGAITPLGFFDPLGLVADGNQERFDRLRTVELKHGRVSMLAVVGYLITANGIRFPGAEGIPDGLAAFPALHTTSDGKAVLMQMLAFFAVAEMINRDAFGKAEFIGDYRNGALDFGWDKLDEGTKLRKRKVELNQGRAAMMGITGLITHEVLGNSILPGGYLPGH
eukprot:CAMPEP_0198155300 /NCGR_PEP_ID=MMETSP1443-20131203/69055_1 /TAXON_ID=186043 /ORGANISM="Entomoneis sp., Strain CCMP2396" /LENGTH=198 /DNA_ID=CAMNT_0043822047 /DNA_START=766 /DNA_END=1362 /DNA_ORIENTATION=-